MITIIMQNKNEEQFQNYDGLFSYIVDLENEKMLEPDANFAKLQWSFAIFSPDNVQRLLLSAKKQPLIVKEAWERGLPLLEICTGDFERPEYHLVIQGLDVGSLKKKWSLAYCASHGMVVSASE